MKILIINPNSDTETNRRILAKTSEVFKGAYDIECVCVKNAPRLVSSYEGEVASIPEMMRMVREGEGIYDAFIVACHADPNMEVLREITTRPVVGIAEASYRFAEMLGSSFALICPAKRSIPRKHMQVRKYHCSDLLKKVIVTKSDSMEDLTDAAGRAAAEDVEAIVLGCANYTLCDKELEKSAGIPVIDGVVCAVVLAAGLAMYRAYMDR